MSRVLKLLRIAAVVVPAGALMATCMVWTGKKQEREKAFCAEHGMQWEPMPNSQLSVCIDDEGFAHPVRLQ